MLHQLEDVGAVICAAGTGLAPADKKLYALRDVTGTVEAIPLIASSIMSKKIAEGTGALVLDVKVGSGAFMKDLDQARELAETMVGARHRRRRAHGRAAHRHVHPARPAPPATPSRSRESVEVLAGGGPADVVELTLALAREMLAGAGRRPTSTRPTGCADGSAMDVWRRMIAAQGGDPDAPLPTARETHVVTAPGDAACSPGSTRWRSGWPPGGSAPAGPARRTRCRPAPASRCTPSPATRSPRASRC